MCIFFFVKVVGVAQIINKNPGGVPFTKEDEKVKDQPLSDLLAGGWGGGCRGVFASPTDGTKVTRGGQGDGGWSISYQSGQLPSVHSQLDYHQLSSHS